jgi:hypothetical protein
MTAGEDMHPGDAVYVSAANTVLKTDGSAVATTIPFLGIVVAGAAGHPTDIASGEEVDVCVMGPVVGFTTNMPAAGPLYLSNNAGLLVTTAAEADKDCIAGYALNTTTLFVQKQVVEFA